MSRAFNKAVRKLFQARMTRFPEFVPAKPPKEYCWPAGELAFRRDHGDTALWLSLIFSPKAYNEFSVECGWSRLGRYPELTSRPNIIGFEPEDLARHAEAFFRLRTEVGNTSDWWSITDRGLSFESVSRACALLSDADALALAEPLVTNALDSIAAAQPLFDRILGFRP